MANKTAMPRDGNLNPIPCMAFMRGAGAHKITVSGTSARNSTAFATETQVVSLYTTEACYVEIGDSTVTATTSTHYMPAASSLFVSLLGGPDKATHIAAIQDTTGGTLYISEML